jgi:hypothetical protein
MIDSVSLTSVPSQAVIAPLTEELATEKATQAADERLEAHYYFSHLKLTHFTTDRTLGQEFLRNRFTGTALACPGD